MSFCSHCGERQSDDAVFCGSCGKRIAGEGFPSPPAPTQPKVSKGKSVFKVLLYIAGALGVLFVGLVVYAMFTDSNVKSDTKVTVQTQSQPSAQTPSSDNKTAPPPAQPAQPTQSAQPAATQKPAAAIPAKVAAIDFGYGFDSGSYKVTRATDAFQAAQLDVIHAVVYVENVKSPITAKGEWVYLGTRDSVWTNDVTLPTDGAFHFNLSKPTKGWPIGDYALKIHINGKEVTYKKFSVR